MLELSFKAATSLSVLGQSFLYNERTHKKIPLPVLDNADMTWLIVRLNIRLPCIDEAHDLDDTMV